jgi:predicted Zn-dependent protease with MMP-like domain
MGLLEELVASDHSDEIGQSVLDLVLHVEEKLESNPLAALEIAERAAPESAAHPEVRLARARAIAAAKGASAARPLLEDLVREEPQFGEARHALALVYEELEELSACTRELLEVRRLDALSDKSEGFELEKVAERVRQTAERVMDELPAKFRRRLVGVPILIEERPSEELVRERFDPRSLGLFEGPVDAERQMGEVAPTPTRIVLYAANLAAFVDLDDEDELAGEVEVTLLHEIGHYFGLDEDELEALGLG